MKNFKKPIRQQPSEKEIELALELGRHLGKTVEAFYKSNLDKNIDRNSANYIILQGSFSYLGGVLLSIVEKIMDHHKNNFIQHVSDIFNHIMDITKKEMMKNK